MAGLCGSRAHHARFQQRQRLIADMRQCHAADISEISFVDHPLGKLFTAKCVFSMHASCVAVNGKGIAFTGRSGAGKSTAAFALMQKGMPIIHDEKLFVQKKMRNTRPGRFQISSKFMTMPYPDSLP